MVQHTKTSIQQSSGDQGAVRGFDRSMTHVCNSQHTRSRGVCSFIRFRSVSLGSACMCGSKNACGVADAFCSSQLVVQVLRQLPAR